MKELERIAPKQKGIVSQSVKEITLSLVDDGFVECEKIGTFVCYWAFPSKATVVRRVKLENLEKNINDAEKKVCEIKKQIEISKCGREENEARTALLHHFQELTKEKQNLSLRLDGLNKCGSEIIDSLKKECEKTLESINRWTDNMFDLTDNIFAIKKWCRLKFNIDMKTLDQQFGIPSDLDYLE
ncbi:unnamed protein product [Dracunculus medinensis]|uniref:Meiotic nuclear division protein 1 homolog n=1 Tax=Dracunculus medinensis TaxID=318479 RepID=A0A0N4UJC0_DRAME|nr:unnamed protein product [Dracunculus medinensis]